MSEVQVVEANDVLVPLERIEAERLDGRIRRLAESARGQLVKVAELVEEAKRGDVHTVLGYPSWTAYLADALGGQLQLPGESRHEVVAYLAGEGMSVRAIAAATGVSKSTVSNDLAEVSNDWTPQDDSADSGVQPLDTSPKREAATVTGVDGKTYTKPKRKPRKPTPKREPVVVVEPEPEPVESTRKVQIPTALRSEVKLLGLTLGLMASLTTDPRWGKSVERFNHKDRTTLDAHIATLQQVRAAMGELYNTTEVSA